jgi:hypothetical protein
MSVHEIDAGRLSHEVCAVDLDRDGKCDIVTTSGVYRQGSTADFWTFVHIGRCGQCTCAGTLISGKRGFGDVIALVARDGKNEVAWFENPNHRGQSAKGRWIYHGSV